MTESWFISFFVKAICTLRNLPSKFELNQLCHFGGVKEQQDTHTFIQLLEGNHIYYLFHFFSQQVQNCGGRDLIFAPLLISADGKYIFVAGENRVSIFNIETGQPVRELKTGMN